MEYGSRAIPSTVQLEDAVCPLGCEDMDEPVLRGYDRLLGLPGEYSVVRCVTCGLQRTSPRPTPAAIGFYYPDNYGPYQGTRVATSDKAVGGLKDRLVEFIKLVFDTKAMAIPKQKVGSMLEIGCASGSFLQKMARRGWLVQGIEYSQSAAQSARAQGYTVETGALETINKPVNSYNLIVGWMVLEHLHQPVQSLRKLASWARPEAMLVLSVPNVGSIEARIFGSRWYALQLPNHLFHYDTSTISKMLKIGGWEVVRIYHQRNIGNLVGSLGHWLHERGLMRLGGLLINFPESGGRLGALLMFPLALPLAWFGQTGRMTVWARRAC